MAKEHYITSGSIPQFNRFGIGFEQMLDEMLHTADVTGNYPPYNIIQTGQSQYQIEVAISGFAEDEIDVEVHKNSLRISGKKKKSEDSENIVYKHRGISSRDFSRVFRLAEHVEVVNAEVKHGILCVYLEQNLPEEKLPKKIAITFKA